MLADEAAVAQHGDFVGDLEQLVHPVGDVDDAGALGFSVRIILNSSSVAAASAEVGSSMMRSRSVADRLGDLHELPAGDGKVAHLGFRIDAEVEPLEQRLGRSRISSWRTKPRRFAVRGESSVLGHRHEGHRVELLMDHGDAVAQRVERGFELISWPFSLNEPESGV